MIRVVMEADVEAFRVLQLRALTEEPEAFGASADDFAAISLPDVAKYLRHPEDAFTLGAFVPNLGVVSTNAAAVNLYHSLGFAIYGTERHALKLGDRYVDEELMVRDERW